MVLVVNMYTQKEIEDLPLDAYKYDVDVIWIYFHRVMNRVMFQEDHFQVRENQI
jgi:hypothetical protein